MPRDSEGPGFLRKYSREFTGFTTWIKGNKHIYKSVSLPRSHPYIEAWDTDKGEQAWKIVRRNGLSHPVQVDKTIYVGTKNRVTALDAESGNIFWKSNSCGGRGVTQPRVANGTVYIKSGNFCIKAINTESGSWDWETKINERIHSWKIADGMIYIGGKSNLYALEQESGKQRWKFRTNSKIEQSPAVANGTVYVISNDGTLHAIDPSTGLGLWVFNDYIPKFCDENPLSRLKVISGLVHIGTKDGRVLALDEHTGQCCWESKYGEELTSMPVVTDEAIFVQSRSETTAGAFHVIDPTTGNQRWEYDDYLDSLSFQITSEHIYFNNDDGEVCAVDKNTGDQEWKLKSNDFIMTAVGDDRVFLGDDDGRVHAIDASDGTSFWKLKISGASASEPHAGVGGGFITNGKLFTFSERELWALDIGLDESNYEVTYNRSTDKHYNQSVTNSSETVKSETEREQTRNWTFQTNENVMTSPTVANDTVFIGNNDGNVYSLDAATGDQQWVFNTDCDEPKLSVLDNTVFVGGYGTVYALQAATGDQQWVFETGDGVRSRLTVVDDTVFVGNNDGNVYALDAAAGERQWVFETSDAINSSPTAVGGTVFVGSKDGNVYALDTATGDQQWAFETGDALKLTMAVAGETIFVMGNRFEDGRNLYALDITSGDEQWDVKIGAGVRSSPTVANGRIYLFEDEFHFCALSATTGDRCWQVKDKFGEFSGLPSSPTVANETVYFGSANNNVYALSTNAMESDDKNN